MASRIHSYNEDISFHNIDQHAKAGQFVPIEDQSALVSYLSKVIPQDTDERNILLTRGYLVWYTFASANDFLNVSEDLKLLNNVLGTNEMFISFCRCADIDCEKIVGPAKCNSDEAFERDCPSHEWSAFYANKVWHLVDPHWCVTCVIGYQPGGRISLEEDGNTELAKTDFSPGMMIPNFNESWFCTNPKLFLYRHLPDDPEWQQLSNNDTATSIGLEQWLNMPYLSISFYEQGLHLLSEESCRLKDNNGKTAIMLFGKDIVLQQYSITYTLLVKESDASNINPSDLPQLVFPGRDNGIFKFEIRFPVKGTYFINILLHNEQAEKTNVCADFIIECDEPDPNCRKIPVDTGIMGFGFGPMAEEAGLKKPSVKGSKLILKPATDTENEDEKKLNEEQKITFKLDVDAINEYEYGSNMYDDETQSEVSTLVNESKRRLVIVPPVRPDSEYALVLTQRRKNTREKFQPVLYYLVTTEEEIDECETLALQKKKQILHDVKQQEKMEKNLSLKEKILQMRAAIDSLSLKGNPADEEEDVSDLGDAD